MALQAIFASLAVIQEGDIEPCQDFSKPFLVIIPVARDHGSDESSAIKSLLRSDPGTSPVLQSGPSVHSSRIILAGSD
jgi:hypothetical protein